MPLRGACCVPGSFDVRPHRESHRYVTLFGQAEQMNSNTSASEHSAPTLHELMAPSQVVTRSGTMLRMVRQGLRDMTDADHDRLLFGFLGVVVFGRSMTLVMQNLRTHDRLTFDAWYGPWQQEMQGDPLMKYFNDLRTKVIHQDAPSIGIVLASSGESALPIGSITIEDMPPPKSHLGKELEDTSITLLCELYYAYLDRLFKEFAPVAFAVQDRLLAERWPHAV